MKERSEYTYWLERLRFESSDADIASGIQAIRERHTGDANAVARLATALAESGRRIQVSDAVTADVASTGGPTSLSTLLTPLYLRVSGAKVPKIGVPGRPAGGIDCLAQIPGYRTEITIQEAGEILASSGYVHFLATKEAAPLDGRVFRIRQATGAQAVPELVVASILAKKLAAGVVHAGLDIRVGPHGNFGKDWSSASKNAELFKLTAANLGLQASAVLTDARFPYQPFIGRKESLIALHDIFEDRATPWLKEHLHLCRTLALACVPPEFRARISDASLAELQSQFSRNLEAQGSSYQRFRETAVRARGEHNVQITASCDGFTRYPIEPIRDLICGYQKRCGAAGAFADPVGIILLHRSGEWVGKGASIATMRADPAAHDTVLTELTSIMAPSPLATGPLMEACYG